MMPTSRRPPSHPLERTRRRAARRIASSRSPAQLVSHHDRGLCDAIPRLWSSSPKMPWMGSLCRHHTASATRAVDPPSRLSYIEGWSRGSPTCSHMIDTPAGLHYTGTSAHVYWVSSVERRC
jgi:hypothetical protein